MKEMDARFFILFVQYLMDILYRRFLVLIFALVFVISAPLLILSTAGYRYNAKTGSFETTGVLVIDTLPTKADIFINDRLNREKTDTILTRLYPGNYNIRIEKPGYHAWEKNLSIKPTLSTFIKDLPLLRKEFPLLRVSGTILDYRIAPNQKSVVFQTQEAPEKLWYFSAAENTPFLVAKDSETLPISLRLITWNERNDRAFILLKRGTQTQAFVFDSAKMTVTLIPFLSGNDIRKFAWNGISPSGYLLENRSILFVDFEKNLSEKYFSNPEDVLLDLMVFQSSVFVLTFDPKKSSGAFQKIHISESGEKKMQSLLTIDISDQAQFTDHINDAFIVSDAANDRMIAISPANDALHSQQISVQQTNMVIKHANNEGSFLAGNNHEIQWWPDGISFSSPVKKTLLLRTGKTLASVNFSIDGYWILYATKDAIHALEFDGRDARNDVSLVTADRLEAFFLNKNGDEIFFLGSYDGKEGIFSLDIH